MAACAGSQSAGAFWALGDFFFRQQESLTLASLQRTVLDVLPSLPSPLSAPEFRACLEGQRGESQVDRDIALADRLGVRATPTVFVNGVRLPPLRSADQLVVRVREALTDRRRDGGK